MSRRWRQCVVEGCERRAMSGRVVCKDHEATAIDVESSRGVVKLEREVRALMVAETTEERLAAARRFRQRVQRGDFAALFSGKFREMIQQAGSVEGLTGEIGALRLAVVRLILEEDDPTKMATALSKVANATAHMMKTQAKLADHQEAMEAEFEVMWEAFKRDKEVGERLEQALAEKRARESETPSPQPSPNSGRGSFHDPDKDVFDVVEGGYATPVEMMPEIEQEMREAQIRYLEERGVRVREEEGRG
jgi:hypothetical protein